MSADIIDILDVSHWSEGLEDYIDVGDMDMYHLLRTFNLLLRDREKLTRVMKALEIENEWIYIYNKAYCFNWSR